MNRLQHIVFREWYTRVRRKAFILGTLLVPFLMAGLVGIMVWMDQSETEHHKVLIVDLNLTMLGYVDEEVEVVMKQDAWMVMGQRIYCCQYCAWGLMTYDCFVEFWVQNSE